MSTRDLVAEAMKRMGLPGAEMLDEGFKEVAKIHSDELGRDISIMVSYETIGLYHPAFPRGADWKNPMKGYILRVGTDEEEITVYIAWTKDTIGSAVDKVAEACDQLAYNSSMDKMKRAIDAKIEQKAAQKEVAAKAKKEETEQAVKKIHEMQPRIKKIIDTLVYIREHDTETWSEIERGVKELGETVRQKSLERMEGIPVPYLYLSGKGIPFLSDGGMHNLGLFEHVLHGKDTDLKSRRGPFLGYEAGGNCGSYDFATNGTDVFYDDEKGIDAFGFREFMRDFDLFEKDFYEWFNEYYLAEDYTVESGDTERG